MNVGIILAMAGLNYSKVKEPDYSPSKVAQKSEIRTYIQNVEKEVLEVWKNREGIKSQLRGKKKFDERSRSIYYDTDGIRENQKEKLRICDDCAGALRIDSSSDRGHHILGIHVPRKACNACKEMAYKWYDEAALRDFNMILLQDRTKDKYIKK